ncbi:MAG: hypothetical protein PVH41_08335 [Anaerolineae bacterium]|jgi:hypothetical protein
MRDKWHRYEERGSGWGRLKVFAGVVTVVFALTLALVVGNKLSAEALGVLAGTVCGVGAAIPTSLIVVAVTRRRNGADSRQGPSQPAAGWARPHPYPPVVVVSPPTGQQRPYEDWNALPSSLSTRAERNFTVVGGIPAEGKGVRYGNERRS